MTQELSNELASNEPLSFVDDRRPPKDLLTWLDMSTCGSVFGSPYSGIWILRPFNPKVVPPGVIIPGALNASIVKVTQSIPVKWVDKIGSIWFESHFLPLWFPLPELP